LKVSRQDLLIHLIKVRWRESKALRSEESKVIVSGLRYEQRKEVNRVFTVLDWNFDI
jgi:hypothetical protein